MDNMRKCICCGKEYEYCHHCGGTRQPKMLWKNNYCSESCRDVFNTITDYRAGEITKEAAKQVLKNIKMENRASYDKEGIGKFVDEILEEKPFVEREKKNEGNGFQFKKDFQRENKQ